MTLSSFKKETEQPQIRFGTDGWRATIGDEFTRSSVERVAQAYADYLTATNQYPQAPSVTIGFDNRFLSDTFARNVSQVLQNNGVMVQLFEEPVPTPLVSFAVTHQRQSGGVVITASHNPPQYNGFKIKDSWGGSAFEETTKAIESLIDSSRPKTQPVGNLISSPPESVRAAYLNQIASLIDLERIKSAGLNVVVDSMHGTGGRIIEGLIVGGKTEVHTIRADRDVLFGGISPEPIDKNLVELRKLVKANDTSIGLATDGDADRLGAVSEQGQTMTMHEVTPLLLLHLLKNKNLSGAVVSTVTQSVLMKRIAAFYGLPLIETPVGFKYIAAEMLQNDVLIGAEESGGIGVKGHMVERDGLFNSLLLLEALTYAKSSPQQLVAQIHQEFGSCFYDRVDMHLPLNLGIELFNKLMKSPPSKIGGLKVSEINEMDGFKLCFNDDSWLMFRRSGTEPVLRIYAEASSMALVRRLLSEGENIAAQIRCSN